jgi:renalase
MARTPPTYTAHRWRYADLFPVGDEGCALHGSDRLGLCGDWLNGGKVQDAWLSGRVLAGQMVDSL